MARDLDEFLVWAAAGGLAAAMAATYRWFRVRFEEAQALPVDKDRVELSTEVSKAFFQATAGIVLAVAGTVSWYHISRSNHAAEMKAASEQVGTIVARAAGNDSAERIAAMLQMDFFASRHPDIYRPILGYMLQSSRTRAQLDCDQLRDSTPSREPLETQVLIGIARRQSLPLDCFVPSGRLPHQPLPSSGTLSAPGSPIGGSSPPPADQLRSR